MNKQIIITLHSFFIVGFLLALMVTDVTAQNSKLPDIKCFILLDYQKDKNYQRINLTDHAETKVVGYISNRPFLNHMHLLYEQAAIRRSQAGTKKGKAYLSIPLTDEGQKIMFDTTSENILHRIAIFINGQLVVAPQIRQGYSGPLIIEGGYSDAEADQIIKAIQGK